MALRPTTFRPIVRAAFQCRTSAMAFSTSAVSRLPHNTRDANPKRGVSALRRQGPKTRLNTEDYGLPEPVLDPKERTEIKSPEDHGLWQFFPANRASLPTPEEDHQHGRGWTAEECRNKSWDDLHKLWWLCVKERNRLATQRKERERLEPGYGEYEAEEREKEVKQTQRAIKHVLTERYYAWTEAREIGAKDPEVDLSGEGIAYTPMEYLEDALETEDEVEGTKKDKKEYVTEDWVDDKKKDEVPKV